jgi:GDP-L-fucose synthase
MQNVNSKKLYAELKQTQINIGTGIDLTIRELAEIVQRMVRFEGQLIWVSAKPDGTFKKQLDVQLLRKLNWNASITLVEGIGQVYTNY